MDDKPPSDAHEAIGYIYDLPDTDFTPVEKEHLNFALLTMEDRVVQRFFLAPDRKRWVGTLKLFLNSIGIHLLDLLGNIIAMYTLYLLHDVIMMLSLLRQQLPEHACPS